MFETVKDSACICRVWLARCHSCRIGNVLYAQALVQLSSIANDNDTVNIFGFSERVTQFRADTGGIAGSNDQWLLQRNVPRL